MPVANPARLAAAILFMSLPCPAQQPTSTFAESYYEKGVSWSPDGTRIAFFSNKSGNDEIYVRHLTTGKETRLTNNSVPDRWSVWSPDGGSLAFVSRQAGNWDVYTMTAEGEGRRQLTEGPGNDLYPTWTRDGNAIIWASAAAPGESLSLRRLDLRSGRQEALPYGALPIAGPTSLSPDGHDLLFGSYGPDPAGPNVDIYRVGTNGRGLRRLTRASATEKGPSWSPDGRRIAFLAGADGDSRVWIMNADGSDPHATALSAMADGGPAWSPDGRILGTHQAVDGVARLVTLDVTSDQVRPLSGDNLSRIYFATRLGQDAGWSIVSVRPDGADRRTEVRYGGGQGEYNPAPGPGGMLYFNTYRFGGWKLARASGPGGAVTRTSPGSDYYTNAAISRDGTAMLFEHTSRTGVDIVLADRNGGAERNLTATLGPGEEHVPSWLPDGRAFVFFGDRSGKQQIYRVNLDGTGLINLSRSGGNDFAPAVSPDGRRVAFYSDREGYLDVFVIDLNGPGAKNLTADHRYDLARWSYTGRTYWPHKLAWSPDGTRLVSVVIKGEVFGLQILRLDGGPPVPLETSLRSPITPAWANAR